MAILGGRGIGGKMGGSAQIKRGRGIFCLAMERYALDGVYDPCPANNSPVSLRMEPLVNCACILCCENKSHEPTF